MCLLHLVKSAPGVCWRPDLGESSVMHFVETQMPETEGARIGTAEAWIEFSLLMHCCPVSRHFLLGLGFIYHR